jgi:thioesterase domain-containing protein/aryl carrier-like protein
VAELRSSGAEVVVLQADVAQSADVARVLAEVRATCPPLRGVFHAAMTLDDATLQTLGPDRFKKVMGPKAAGAWNLHAQTSGDPLEYFVMYSSAAATLGNPGQANYAAANLFLDQLAHYRHAQGLPALTVNWGAIEDTGFVARHALGTHLKRLGLTGMPSSLLLEALGALLGSGATHAMVADIDWNILPGHRAPRYACVRSASPQSDSVADPAERGAAQAILTAAAEQRAALVQGWLRDLVAGILAIAPSKLDAGRPLTAMGLDSLMAVELGTSIKRQLGLEVTTMTFMRGPTLVELAGELLGMLEKTSPVPATIVVPVTAPEKRTRIAAKAPANTTIPAAEATAASERLVIPIRKPGSAVPLFLGTDFTGSYQALDALAALLGDDQPVYALQTPVLQAHTSSWLTMKELASALADMVRAICPAGPYRLGGWSIGGLIALEAARRLEAHGPVEFVALLDARPPRREFFRKFLWSRMPRFLGPVLRRADAVEAGQQTRPDAVRELTSDTALGKVQARLQRAGHLPPDFKLGRLLYHIHLMDGYRIDPYPGRVLLLQAAEVLAGDPAGHDSAFGWPAFCPQLETISVPGNISRCCVSRTSPPWPANWRRF